jgi:hypothetical protein
MFITKMAHFYLNKENTQFVDSSVRPALYSGAESSEFVVFTK